MKSAQITTELEWACTFDAIVDPIMILDDGFRIVKANKAMAEKLGLMPEEMIGENCCRIIHGLEEPPPYCPHARVLVDSQPHTEEIYEPRLGGHFEFVVSPLRDSDGTVCGAVHYARDINSRKQADDALKREREFLCNLLQGSAIATFVLDPQHNVLLWNRACEELTGIKAEEVIGTSQHWRAFYSHERPCLADIVMEGDKDQYQQMYEQVSKSALSHEGLQAEGRYPELNGSERYILFNAAPIRNSSGTLLGAIETLLDITEHKKLESQLFQAQKMEAVGQLAGGVAHDFNNILTAIIGFSTLIDMNMEEDDPQRANLNGVLAAADRAADLTRSLLTFSRKKVLNPQSIDINQTIKKANIFLKRIISEDIEIRTKFQQETLPVDADNGQIEQVLMNLVTNARDAMPNGGLLTIETAIVEVDSEFIRVHGYGKPGWYASISVSDTGEGMDEATCNKVFEPFFTTKEPDKGTGLGMSVVFGIIKQHNGFINVYSEPVIGTTFTILLPLVQSALKEILASEEEIIERGHETILVADDDDSLRDLTEKALRMFGYTVITAKNGSDALARFKERNGRIDLAILDIIMPEKNGKESFDEMLKFNPAVKAIFVSGYTSGILLKKGLIGENLDFIAKPVHIKQLLVKIRKVLDDKPNMSHPPQLCASF